MGETKELIRTSSQKVLDSVKDVDRNIKRLSNQMKDLGKSLGTAIEVGTVQVSYHEDFQHFDIMSRTFEELERGTSGTIINNRRVTRFKNAVDQVYKGAEQTYYNFHTMVVGNRLGLKSIFEINTKFCKSKDYIVLVMNQLVQFYATAKAMDGRDLDPVKAENFKEKMIAVNQKYIEACGCSAGQTPKRMSNLQLLVSQPVPKTSVGEFYNQIIADDTISRTDLKKLNLLFKAKPFDFSPRILTAIRSQPIEVLEMILNLANFDSFSTLPLLENKLICPADPDLGLVVELEPVSATQSSILEGWGDPHQYEAGNCIDGDTGGVRPDGQYKLCHTNDKTTNDDATPWIAIDYGTSVTVQKVEIFNREDDGGESTRNVDVRISDELPTSGSQMFSGGILLGHFAGPATNGQHIIISGQETSGRYVIVQMDTGGLPLMFQEVKTFGRATTLQL